MMRREHVALLIVLSLPCFMSVAGAAETQTTPLQQCGLGTLTSAAYSPDGKRILTAGGGGAFLWDVGTGKVIRRFFASGHNVNAVAFSPDGSRALTGSSDTTAKLWNIETGAEIRTFSSSGAGYYDWVVSVAFSPDGTKVLTGSTDYTAKLWDVETGTEIRTFSGHTDTVFSVACSPDGTKVLTGSRDNTARLWDLATGDELTSFTNHTFWVTSVAFSPDGTRALTGSHDGTAKLWNVETGAEIRTFSGHAGGIYSVAFSPDGTTMLTGSTDWTAKLWNVETGTEIRTFSGHAYYVLSVAFSPDGTRALTASEDGTAKLWNVETTPDLIRTLSGHTNYVNSVAFSPDGNKALTGSHDGTAKLWNVQTGAEIRTFSGHLGPVTSVAFSPDGTKALTGSYDNTARLWDLATGDELTSLTGHTGMVLSVAFSPDGTTALTGGSDSTARLWDLATGDELTSLTGHTGVVRSVTFSPDGTTALTGSFDTTAKLWNLETGTEIRNFGHSAAVYAIAFSPDGTRALTAGGAQARLWNVETGGYIRTFSGHSPGIYSVAFSPDGIKMLTGGGDSTAKLWVAETGAEIHTFSGHADSVLSVAFSPDGTKVLTGSRDNTAKLWNEGTGTALRTFSGHTSLVFSVAFSPDSTTALTGSMDRTAKLWDVETGTLIRSFPGHRSWVHSVAFSPDGTRVLTGSHDGTAKLWNLETGAEIRTFTGHANQVMEVAFSPDGTKALTGSADHTAKLWNINTGAEIRTFSGHSDWVHSVAFSPDGTRALTGGDGAKLWDVETGGYIRTFPAPGLYSVAFSPDGTKVLTGGGSWIARLWDVETGALIRTFSGHTNTVWSVAFSPDGTKVLTGSRDETAKLWDVETGDEICTFLGHTDGLRATAFSADGTTVLTGGNDGTALLWELNPPRAVVVAGGGDYAENPIAQQTDDLGAYAYKTLKRRGYKAEDIMYLTAFGPTDPLNPAIPYRDADGDGLNDVDDWATYENLQQTLTGDFATNAGRLLILMMDHGYPAGTTPRLSEPAFTGLHTIAFAAAAHGNSNTQRGAASANPITTLPEIEFTREAPESWNWSSTFNAPLDPGTYTLAVYASYPGIPYVVFKLNETQTLPTFTLDAWLDTLQQNHAIDVTLIVDACYSGKFVEDCQGAPAGRERIVISSTGSDSEAVFLPPPDLTSFMFVFLGSAYMGNSMGEAWRAGRQFFEEFPVAEQVPQLDDGSSSTTIADLEFFGASWIYGVQSTEDVNRFFPAFEDWTTNTLVSPGDPVNLWTQMLEGQDPLEVVAVVRPPAPEVISGEPVTNLPHVYLQRKSSNPADPDYRMWEASVSDVFTEFGVYVVTFTARFEYERISNPVYTRITVAEGIDPDTTPIRALLVIGDSADPELSSAFEGLGPYAYSVYLDRFQDDEGIHHPEWIEYLTPFLDADRDGTPSAAAIVSYIDTLPSEIGRLYVHLIGDSDTAGEVELSLSDSLTASALDTALDNLQSRQTCTVILIVDAPYSGAFLPICKATGGQERVILSGSRATDATALFLEAPTLSSFSQKFLATAYQGTDLYHSFSSGLDFLQTFLQSGVLPELDDTGDGTYVPWQDGALAQTLYLGRRYAFAGDDAAGLPFILDVTSTQTVTVGSPVTFSAQLLEGIEPTRVFAQLVAPPAPAGEQVYSTDFSDWQFMNISPQSLHTSHWDHATQRQESGAIGFEGPDESTNYFALWHNDGPDPGAIEWADDSLWRALFSISTSQADANLMPSVRMRIYLEHQKYHSYVRLYPGEWLDVPQHGSGSTDVSVFLHPPSGVTDTGLNLAFAMIDFTDDPRSGDQTGTVWLDEVRVLRYPVADLSSGWTSQDSWTSSGLATGWTYAGGGGGYSAPSSSSGSSGISITSTVSNSRHFGAWTVNDDERPLLLPDQLYRVIFNMSADNVLAPDIRLRTHSLNQSATTGWRYASYVEIVPGSGTGEAMAPATGRDYYVYFSPPGDYGSNTLMVLAFDLIDIEAAPLWGGTDTLGSVTIEHTTPLP